MHGAARLDISQIQPNTGDAGGEENDGISPGATQKSHARQTGRTKVRGSQFEVFGTSNPELRTSDRACDAGRRFSILLRGGRRRCPEERVHKGFALKILQILDRLPDSDQPHGQLEFFSDRDDDPPRAVPSSFVRTKPVTPTT